MKNKKIKSTIAVLMVAVSAMSTSIVAEAGEGFICKKTETFECEKK